VLIKAAVVIEPEATEYLRAEVAIMDEVFKFRIHVFISIIDRKL